MSLLGKLAKDAVRMIARPSYYVLSTVTGKRDIPDNLKFETKFFEWSNVPQELILKGVHTGLKIWGDTVTAGYAGKVMNSFRAPQYREGFGGTPGGGDTAFKVNGGSGLLNQKDAKEYQKQLEEQAKQTIPDQEQPQESSINLLPLGILAILTIIYLMFKKN